MLYNKKKKRKGQYLSDSSIGVIWAIVLLAWTGVYVIIAYTVHSVWPVIPTLLILMLFSIKCSIYVANRNEVLGIGRCRECGETHYFAGFRDGTPSVFCHNLDCNEFFYVVS